MHPIYQQDFTITDVYVDCYGRLLPSKILYIMQEVAGFHFAQLSMDYDSLAQKRMFWAVTRHKVQITRLPLRGETIRVETWPMPTTRVAYPRSMVAYDRDGNEVFRSISLWVLMDQQTRAMVLPGKSGILVSGILRGNELPSPRSLPPTLCACTVRRRVCFTDLDANIHMNNGRYLEWAADLLPASFHKNHRLQDVTLCYLSEAREGDELEILWEISPEGVLHMDVQRCEKDKKTHIFTADLHYSI